MEWETVLRLPLRLQWDHITQLLHHKSKTHHQVASCTLKCPPICFKLLHKIRKLSITTFLICRSDSLRVEILADFDSVGVKTVKRICSWCCGISLSLNSLFHLKIDAAVRQCCHKTSSTSCHQNMWHHTNSYW